jgi:phosphoglycolate phosphatase-like HAD superfamily hydrolase
MGPGAIHAIGFDWDGTLVDSMGVKAKCFAQSIIEAYPEVEKHRSEIESLFFANRGYPRLDQLRQVQERYGLAPFNNAKFGRWNDQFWSDLFTALYVSEDMPLFPDAIVALERLHSTYPLFLSSSVPQADLDWTLESYPIRDYFQIVLGSRDDGKFRKGLPHFSHVSERLSIPLDRMAYVGDGPADVRYAKEAGCYAIGKIDVRNPLSRAELEGCQPDMLMERLEELLDRF